MRVCKVIQIVSLLVLSTYTFAVYSKQPVKSTVTQQAHSYEEIKEEFSQDRAWGLLTSIDLHDCNPKKIRSEADIKQYVKELCELIDAKRFGETVVVNFGEDERIAGFSMTQLIETSLISGHFVNRNNYVYMDVFSCKAYDPAVVIAFTRKFFEAKKVNSNILLRR